MQLFAYILVLQLKQPTTGNDCVTLIKPNETCQLTNQSAHPRLRRWHLFHATLFLVNIIITDDISAWLGNGRRPGPLLLTRLLRCTRLVSRKQYWTTSMSTLPLLNLLEVLPECRLIWSLNDRATKHIHLGSYNTENRGNNVHLAEAK